MVIRSTNVEEIEKYKVALAQDNNNYYRKGPPLQLQATAVEISTCPLWSFTLVPQVSLRSEWTLGKDLHGTRRKA